MTTFPRDKKRCHDSLSQARVMTAGWGFVTKETKLVRNRILQDVL